MYYTLAMIGILPLTRQIQTSKNWASQTDPFQTQALLSSTMVTNFLQNAQSCWIHSYVLDPCWFHIKYTTAFQQNT